MWNLQYNTNQHIYETLRDSQIKRTGLSLPRGSGVRGEKIWEFGISICKLLHIECINNKVLLYNTGNYIQYPVIYHNGKEYIKQHVYICITESIGCTPQTNTTL